MASQKWRDIERKCKMLEDPEQSVFDDLNRKLEIENDQDYCDLAIQRAIQENGKTEWPSYELEGS